MIETRAISAAGTRSFALLKQCHALDRKSRSADSHQQSSAVQLQKRWALPFTYRQRGALLPQFSSSAGGGGEVVACASASPNGTAPKIYAKTGISRGRACLSIRTRFSI